MRLLKTRKTEAGNFVVKLFTDEQLRGLPYAILSHTWGPDEATLQNINEPSVSSSMGYKKIEQCCSVARKMGYEYVWIDTCCIDKTSSAELSEAINSMFAWYQEAKVCYAYLSDVPHIPFEASRWFTRGWTLQELIAPRYMIFFDGSWKRLGDKRSLARQISECTPIPDSILWGEKDIDTFSTAQKMSWAAERQTSRVEDRAYCLMGLFGVNMPLIYGEREAAFIRLQEEILRISEDHSLFAWKSSDTRAGLLAPSPAAFLDSHDIVPCETFDTFSSPLIISGRGIHLDLCFIGLEQVGLGLAVLQCKKLGGEATSVAVFVRDTSLAFKLERFKRVYCDDFRHLDLKRYHTHQYRMTRMCIESGRITRFKSLRGSKEYNNLAPPHIYPDPKMTQSIDWGSPRVEVYLWLLLTRTNLAAALNAVSNGQTPLSWAAENGLENYVNILLERGATTEVDDKVIDTPLALASKNGHTAIVKLLLDKGASARAAGSSGKAPLVHGSYAGHEDIVRMLIDKGADVNAKGRHGDTPLIHAARGSNWSIANILIEKGIDINTKDQYGYTPLFYAIRADEVAMVKRLIDKGADLNAKDECGYTPLFRATFCDRAYIARVLVDNGANINTKDQDGMTPLAHAVFNNRVDIVNMLLKRGAEIDQAHKYSLALLTYAINTGDQAILNLLETPVERLVRKSHQGILKLFGT
ncbi:hypothetical protein RU639_005953 [Aspergillus parasiticus]